MSKHTYPFDMEVMTRKAQVIKGDYTYTLLSGTSEGRERILIDNHKTKTQGVCVPLSAINKLLGEK